MTTASPAPSYSAIKGADEIGDATVELHYVWGHDLEVPPGPDAALVRIESGLRVRAAAIERTKIGAEVPAALLAGAAYGPNVIKIRDLAPVTIAADPYGVSVCTAITVTVEVRQ